jgi:hypothetical protein
MKSCQIEDDLLKLSTITRNGPEIVGKLLPQDHPVSLKVIRTKRNNLTCSIIQAQPAPFHSLCLRRFLS